MIFKRWICLLLAVILCVGMLAACSNDASDDEEKVDQKDPEQEEQAPDEEKEEKRWLDDLPEASLNGIELRFAYLNAGPVKSGCSINAEEQMGDLINDAMYNRNTAVEERFDVLLSGEEFSGFAGLSVPLTPALTAGSTDYDVLVGYEYFDVGLAATGLMYNFNRLDEDYVNIENPWWSTDYINGINYSDKLFWLTGDITLLHISQIVAAYVNAEIYEEIALQDYGSLYDLVWDKEWTFETMTEIAERAYVDLNGNDAADRGDRFGYEQSLGVEMAYCAGINSSARDEYGNITVAIDDPKTADIMWYLSNISTADFSTVETEYVNQLKLFTSGEAMIYFRTFSTAEEATVREMDSDFYIVPVPLGDYTCEEYRSTCSTGNNLVGLPHTSQYLNETALVLEALAAESHRSVSPTYYDIILKDRYTRDNESKEMIDMIRDSVGVDFINTWSYNYTEAYNFYSTFDTTTVASRIATYAPQWEKVLENLLEKLDDLD